jgi:hypothetical protein
MPRRVILYFPPYSDDQILLMLKSRKGACEIGPLRQFQPIPQIGLGCTVVPGVIKQEE